MTLWEWLLKVKNDKCHDEQQCSIMFYLHDHCIYYTIATHCQRKWTQKLEGYWTVDSSTLALPVGQTWKNVGPSAASMDYRPFCRHPAMIWPWVSNCGCIHKAKQLKLTINQQFLQGEQKLIIPLLPLHRPCTCRFIWVTKWFVTLATKSSP